jgi:hypothetical protein
MCKMGEMLTVNRKNHLFKSYNVNLSILYLLEYLDGRITGLFKQFGVK